MKRDRDGIVRGLRGSDPTMEGPPLLLLSASPPEKFGSAKTKYSARDIPVPWTQAKV